MADRVLGLDKFMPEDMHKRVIETLMSALWTLLLVRVPGLAVRPKHNDQTTK